MPFSSILPSFNHLILGKFMGIALALLSHPVIHRFFHSERAAAANAARYAVAVSSIAVAADARAVPAASRRPALRVVRMIDTTRCDRPASARVLISGSIDQVCAELDRLAAIEAAA